MLGTLIEGGCTLLEVVIRWLCKQNTKMCLAALVIPRMNESTFGL